MQYFAYGSNMHAAQMAQRCPEATPGQVGQLAGWRFLINQRGVATVVPDPTSAVFGVLWTLGPGDLATLDRFEGVHAGRYGRRVVHVTTGDRDARPVQLYVDHRDQPGLPRPGYMEKVLAGATSFELPNHYLGHLSSFAVSKAQ